MRLEIIVPDSTPASRKAKLTRLTKRLSAHPELIDEIRLSADADDAAIQKLFTPELLAEIDAAGEDMKAGNRVSLEELDASLAATKARWQAANPV